MEAYTQEQMALYNALANCTVRMQSGDETAYNDIYNMMFSHVNALIKSRGISEDDCVDIAQETMISVYKYINTINDPQSTYKWIMSLASNKIADYFRKNSKRIENETYIAAEDEDDMGEAERLYNMSHDTQSGQISLKVPEDIFVNREKQQMLIGVVNSLKDEQKQIVMMHCFSDMTFKDIASALGVSENTVKTKFYRSLNKLESSIYEVEKREGVRLHTVGFVPFMLFLFMLYSQNTPICTQTIETVTNRIGKQITDMHSMAAQNAGQGGNNPNDTNHTGNTPNADNPNGNTANNNYNANAKMKADAAQARSAMNANAVKGLQTGTKVGIKAFVSTHKIASIVVGTIIAGSAVGGGIYAATAADSQDVDIVYDSVVKDTSADTEVIETSETQKLTDEEVFNDFLSTMTFVSGDVGTIDCTSGGPMGEQYITDVSINDPIGSCIADFDGDGEKELLVVNYSGDSGITLNIYENINGECVRSDEATFSDDGLIWNEKNVDVMLYEQNNNVYIFLQYCSVYEYLGDGTYCGFALCHYDGGLLISDYNNYFYGSSVDDDRYIRDAEQLCAFLGIVNYDEEEILYTACFSKYLATEQMVVSLRTTPAFSDSNGNEFRAYEEQLKNGSLSRFTVGNVSIKSYTN
nr:sigma-70 family RNA polymerase sigma factor [uncultured Agathobacter sp.]